MPNDSLFDSEDEKPDADVGADKGDKGKDTSPSFTAADLKAAIAEGMSSVSGRMAEHNQQILQYIQAQLPSKKAELPADDLAQSLLNDPKSVVQKLTQEWAEANLGPHLQSQIADRAEDLREKHETRIDGIYGEGTFADMIWPKVEARLAAMPYASRGNKTAFQTVLQSVMGDDTVLEELMDRRQKHAASKAAPTGILKGGRTPTNTPQWSEDDKTYMEEYKRAMGVTLDPKKYEKILMARDAGGRWVSSKMGLKHQNVQVDS